MKLNKIFAAALAILTMTACDDDASVNTVNVTVNMGETQLSMSEDFTANNYNYIPVVLSGEATNGPVTVTIEVEKIGAEPAVENEDYIFTSKTITIPAGQSEGAFEFHTAGDDIENPDRQFKATIVSAEGATIGSQATTVVSLLDNERLLPEAYAKVIGNWMSPSSLDGAYNCTIEGYPVDDPKYLKYVKVVGLFGQPIFSVDLGFSLDASTGMIGLVWTMPQVLGQNLNFSAPIGVADVVCLPYIDGGLYLSGSISAVYDPAGTEFTFDGGAAAGIFAPGNHTAAGFMGYVYDRAEPITFQKVQ